MTIDLNSSDQLTARAEFYLCMARAFLPPFEETTFCAMREALPDDLEDLAALAGYDLSEPLARYREEIGRVPTQQELLQVYSALFIAPPRPAQINVGVYLDGAVDGGSVKRLEEDYRRCGVERSEDFHDLSDHVAVQLEFAAFLWLREMRDAVGADKPALPVMGARFLATYAIHWLPRFVDALANAHEARELIANPYLPLAQILWLAVERDAEPAVIDERALRRERARARAHAKYAQRGIGPEQLREIAEKLRSRGLSTAHLDVPAELRDADKGWHTRSSGA